MFKWVNDLNTFQKKIFEWPIAHKCSSNYELEKGKVKPQFHFTTKRITEIRKTDNIQWARMQSNCIHTCTCVGESTKRSDQFEKGLQFL